MIPLQLRKDLGVVANLLKISRESILTKRKISNREICKNLSRSRKINGQNDKTNKKQTSCNNRKKFLTISTRSIKILIGYLEHRQQLL